MSGRCLDAQQSSLLRLLVAPAGSFDQPLDASLLVSASGGVVALRTCERLRALGRPLPAEWLNAEVAERDRIARTTGLIERLSLTCEREGITFVLPKAFQHSPDMGHDIDLLILEGSRRVDQVLVDEYAAGPGPDSLVQRIAGKKTYRIPGCEVEVEVHNGRLGHLGEHRYFAEQICARRREAPRAAGRSWQPSDEDALLLQAIQRVCGHRFLRISDLVRTASLLSGQAIDWRYIDETARRAGIAGALSEYLSGVSACFAEAGLPLGPVPWPLSRSAVSRGRFSHAAVARAYAWKAGSDALHGRWACTGRVFLLPLAVFSVVLRKAWDRAQALLAGCRIKED